jgi:hypothetical protein
MVEKKEQTREEVIADYVAEKHLAAKKNRKGRSIGDDDASVTINSLMDAMFIILVFLLMNYSIDPIKVDSGEDLALPASITEVNPSASPTVTITARSIIVDDTTIVNFEQNNGVPEVPVRAMLDQKHSTGTIVALRDKLKDMADEQATNAVFNGKSDASLTIIAHGETPYSLLSLVLSTASKTPLGGNFSFAVVKGGTRGAEKR